MTDILTDTMTETERTLAADAHLRDEDTVVMELNGPRFEGMSRSDAHDKGSWNASYLANRLRLSPEGLEALAEYFSMTGSDLRERAYRMKADRLRLQTDAWRAAGCPGRLAPIGTPPLKSEQGNKAAMQALEELFG